MSFSGFMVTNRYRQTIPEAFIWYVFYALAKGLVNMEQGPFGDYLRPTYHTNGAYVIHRDMKPDNGRCRPTSDS